jgi:hypothetical protein
VKEFVYHCDRLYSISPTRGGCIRIRLFTQHAMRLASAMLECETPFFLFHAVVKFRSKFSRDSGCGTCTLNMALQCGLRRNFPRDFTYSSTRTSVSQSHASTRGDPAAISHKACISSRCLATTLETCRSGVISARVLSTWTVTARWGRVEDDSSGHAIRRLFCPLVDFSSQLSRS